jgi:hypothetical protein
MDEPPKGQRHSVEPEHTHTDPLGRVVKAPSHCLARAPNRATGRRERCRAQTWYGFGFYVLLVDGRWAVLSDDEHPADGSWRCYHCGTQVARPSAWNWWLTDHMRAALGLI